MVSFVVPITFKNLEVGFRYSRPYLAQLWGYKTYNAIARGVITPRGTNKIVLFITREKQTTLPQYSDVLEGGTVSIEGELKNKTDKRIVEARHRGDEIHVFYRQRHHQDFTYHGEAILVHHQFRQGATTLFTFALRSLENLARDTLATEAATTLGVAIFSGAVEGRLYLARHRRFERSLKNRIAALQIHGTTCVACGFNFDAAYGAQHARHFIQIHHLESIARGVRKIDPATDLVPLCSNCHSMAHRNPREILPLADLKRLISLHRR